jgi:hypothetical protein
MHRRKGQAIRTCIATPAVTCGRIRHASLTRLQRNGSDLEQCWARQTLPTGHENAGAPLPKRIGVGSGCSGCHYLSMRGGPIGGCNARPLSPGRATALGDPASFRPKLRRRYIPRARMRLRRMSFIDRRETDQGAPVPSAPDQERRAAGLIALRLPDAAYAPRPRRSGAFLLE